jgi:hypothetical protein
MQPEMDQLAQFLSGEILDFMRLTKAIGPKGQCGALLNISINAPRVGDAVYLTSQHRMFLPCWRGVSSLKCHQHERCQVAEYLSLQLRRTASRPIDGTSALQGRSGCLFVLLAA